MSELTFEEKQANIVRADKAVLNEQQFQQHKKELFSGVLVEECAEVVQAMSKINRFGINSVSPYEGSVSNRQALVSELGDVLAMIELLKDVPYFSITDEELEVAKAKKIKKMNYWLHNPIVKAD